MPYLQKTSPPATKQYSFSLVNFVGGLNNNTEIPADNQAMDIMNMVFVDDTVMQKRNGQTTYDGYILPSAVVFIDQYMPYQEPPQLIRATQTEVYAANTKIASVANRITGTNFNGYYLFADGVNIYVYGKFAQTTDTYTTVNGTPNPNYSLMTLVNPPSGYTPLDTTHTQGVTVIDYTNYTICYEPCAEELQDTNKEGNVIPDSVRILQVYNGRLVASGDQFDSNNVFLSDIQNPFYFPAAVPIQLPPNSDSVKCLFPFDNGLVVGREHDVYIIRGFTNDPNLGVDVFTLNKLNVHAGFVNEVTTCLMYNFLCYLGADGNIYTLKSSKYNYTGSMDTTLISHALNLSASPINLDLTNLSAATSIFFRDMLYVSIQDKVLVYSFRHNAWSLLRGLNARSFTQIDMTLIWGNDNGQTAMFSNDYLDFGEPFRAYWTSKYFTMGDEVSYKQFREFYIVGKTYSDFKSDVHVTFEVDYDKVDADYSITTQVSVWGKSKFGDRFILKDIAPSFPFTLGRRGRNIRFTLSNGHDPSAPVATKTDLIGYPNATNGTLVYVNDEATYYLFDGFIWTAQNDYDLNETFTVHQINGTYELRGKR